MIFTATENGRCSSIFYDVYEAVGEGCPNLPDDVTLVQYLLYRIYRKTGSPPAGKIKIDGVCGAVTQSWIHKFQWDVWYEGNEVYPDGVVSPARIARSIAPDSFSTILYLNAAMKKLDLRTYFLMSRMQMQISSLSSFPRKNWKYRTGTSFQALAV